MTRDRAASSGQRCLQRPQESSPGRAGKAGENRSQGSTAMTKPTHTSLLALALVSILGTAGGCASTDVRTETTDISGPLPRPDRVLVYDLRVSPEEVQLDQGISARVAEAAKGTSRTEQEIATGRKVAGTLSKHLVKEIQNLGFDAERAFGRRLQENNDLAIEGYFLSIDEGNRTERVVIGLGAGRTDVQAEVAVYQSCLLRERLAVDAKSGLKPGMAETMGAGAAAGNLATSAVMSAGMAGASETFGADVEADAARAAKKIAERLKVFFAREGWILE
jgi:hypothetical protein